MKYVNLGRSGLKVSRLCLGCMSYGDPERLPQPWSLDEKASRPLIRQALEAGINFFDTANIYSGGSSEEITGKALREMARRDEIVVATKTFFPWRNSPNTGFLSRKAIFQSIDYSLMRLGMDYVDLFQIHRFDHSTPVEETMEALHDLVKSGKVRYIGASSMEAWRFAKMQHTAERNGWTRFITMQPQYNLLYREEEREMLPLCEDQGVGVIPWSPMARGRLTHDWSVTSRRTQNDAFALKMYENAALLDKPVIDVVARIAEKHDVQEPMLHLPGCYQKRSSQPRSLARPNQNIFPRLSAHWTFHLAMLKSRNSRHSICRTPSTGSFPRFLIRPLHSRRLQQYRTVNPLPWPGVAGSHYFQE